MRFVAALIPLLAGCVTGGGLLPGRPVSAPDWVRTPPADTAALYYGVGEGPDVETARRAALRDVAAKLRVSISAKVDSQVTVVNEAADRVNRSRISEEVRKTTFSRHQLERSETSGGNVFALVSVDRQLLVSETRDRLDEIASAVRQALAAGRNAAGLDRLRIGERARTQAEEGGDLLSLLASASPGFNRDPYARDFEAARRLNDDARAGLSFRLQYRPADEDVAGLLRQSLADAGLRVQEGGGSPAVLALSVDAREQSLYGSVIVRLTASLVLRSDHGGVFAQKEYAAEGSSAADRAMARQAAVRKLAAQFKARGAAAVIGLDTAAAH
jgi:hypothetical protein